MKKTRRTRWSLARLAGVALLALAAGCQRPSDENWLRVVQFEDADGTALAGLSSSIYTETSTTTTEGTTTTVAISDPDYVTAVLDNGSVEVSTGDPAGGVTVDQVQITYQLAGYSPPVATFAVTVRVPANTTGGSDGYVKLSLPLVSSALKSWLAATVPEGEREGGLEASAQLVFHARSDEGSEVEAKASISISFVNKTTVTQ